MTSLHEQTVTELVELIRTRTVTCRQVVEAHLARMESLNTPIRAVTLVLGEQALAMADAADKTPTDAHLRGIPFTIKEDLDCVGSPTTRGLRFLANALPYVDAPSVQRLKAAGAIPIGRTNTSEMGLRLDTDNPLRGRTRNPWNGALTVGGSSGGDAAAVATGMVPLGLGGDLGGSLRAPAGACGVTTLKPTTGRIAYASSLEPQDFGMAGQLMLAVGPITRSAADLALVFPVLAGRDIRDPRSVDAPLKGPTPDEKRAALVTSLPGGALPADIRAAVERAGKILEESGWAVEEADPPELERVNEVWHKIVATDFSAQLQLLRPVLSPPLYDHMARVCGTAGLDGVSNLRLHSERSRLMRAWSGFMAEYPVVIGPNWAAPLWPVDSDLDPKRGLELLKETTRFMLPGNALGLPCVALPMGVANGLPTGIQVYADLWREDLCLEVARLIEVAVGFKMPMEPVF
ncbi:MAG: indole acetimide hydrolase [Deltaproteobacteria bacterium]|nr:indole acetimide hydrolase [Deltaproteobacteria bacterium]